MQNSRREYILIVRDRGNNRHHFKRMDDIRPVIALPDSTGMDSCCKGDGLIQHASLLSHCYPPQRK